MMTKERRADLEALADKDPHMCLLRELLNEIAELEARAVVVPDYATMADLAWRHHFDPLHGPTDMFAAGRTAMYKAMCAELRPIPADRVLGDGEVKILESERRELALLRQHFQLFEKEHSDDLSEADRAFNARQEVDELLRRHLRANQGGAAT